MNKEIKYIYVAGPITIPDPMENTRRAILIADKIMDLGFTPYIPHLSVLHNMIKPRGYEEWMDYDFSWLDRCDALFRIKGVSSGADREVERAIQNGQPVIRSLQMLRKIRRLKSPT